MSDLQAAVNLQAEQAVVSYAFLFGMKSDTLRTGDFASKECAALHTVVDDYIAENGTLENKDWLRIQTELGKRGIDFDVRKIIEPFEYAAASSFDYYAGLVADAARRRETAQALESALVEVKSPRCDLVDLAYKLDAIRGGLVSQPTSRRSFGWMSSAELESGDFKLEYFIDGLLVRGQPGVIAGPGKSLKTGLSIDLTIALATGGWFVQKFKANRATRTALISGESGRATIQETAKRIAVAKGLDLPAVKNAVWAFDLPMLGHAGSEAELERFIDQQDIQVLIIDPTYLALAVGDDAGNLFKMGALLKGLSAIAQRTDCTPLLVHHYKKSVPVGDTPELPWMAWAGLPEWARQWLLLNRRTAYDPSNAGSHKLWMVSGGSAGHSGMWGIDIEEGSQNAGGRFWNVSIMLPHEAKATCATSEETAREAKAEAATQRKLERDLEKLLAALAKCPNGETVSKLGSTCGMNSNRYLPAVELGKERGRICECEVTKGKATHPGIKLKSDDSDDSDSLRQSDSSGVRPTNSLYRGIVGPSDQSDQQSFRARDVEEANA